METTEDAGAVAADGAPPPAVAAVTAVPEQLSLLYFLNNSELSDCVVRLQPGRSSSAGAPDEAAVEFECHRVALCASSGFFFRQFLGSSGADSSSGRPTVDLPELPNDEELRRQVDVAQLFPLVLRYIYSSQIWASIASEVTPINAMGLFALGELLEIKSLAKQTFEHLESSALDTATAARFLYVAVQLRGQGDSWGIGIISERCTQVLSQGFVAACASSESVRLLCQLPMDVLAPILTADELNVSIEGDVLEFARRVLRSRVKRDEANLIICDAKLEPPGATEILPRLKAGCAWEVLVVEEMPPPTLEERTPSAADDPRYLGTAGVLQLSEPGSNGEYTLFAELRLRIPIGAVGIGRTGSLVLRAIEQTTALAAGAAGATGPTSSAASEILLAGLLPTDQLPALQSSGESGGSVGPLAAPTRSPEGKPMGIVHFSWRLEPISQAQPGVEASANGENADVGEGQVQAPVAVVDSKDSTLSDEESQRLLATVRFSHLKHEELLVALKDPVLLEAGAQPYILEALSARLAMYEQTAQAKAPSQGPRPSTLSSTIKPAPPFQPQPPPALAATAPPSAVSNLGRAGFGGAGAAGHPLFPCGACGGRGQMLLRQQDLQWLSACSRYPSCQNASRLPSCVTAAAVDGHCAACTLRLGSDVRTLTVRVGREHAAMLVKMPGGVDTLRGVCVAGCTDILSRLGA